MDITQQVEATVTVLVRMDEAGTVTARLVGHMPYATVAETVKDEGEKDHVPMVSAEVECSVEDCATLATVLTEIAGRYTERLATQLGDARAEARRVARAMGEIV